jgi:hypothetical protein
MWSCGGRHRLVVPLLLPPSRRAIPLRGNPRLDARQVPGGTADLDHLVCDGKTLR